MTVKNSRKTTPKQPEGKGKGRGRGTSPSRPRKVHRASAAAILLELFAKKYSRKEYLDAVVELLQQWTGCSGVGIRIVDRQGNIPYTSHLGFSREFWESENMLSIKRDQCACVRVVRGEPDPQDLPYITPNGSFHCEDTARFVGCLTEDEGKRFRGLCVAMGYATVSVIPVRYRDRVVGAIHLADCQKGKVPLRTVEFIESLCPIVGEAVHRFNLEEELQQSEERYRVLFNNVPAGIIRTTPEGRLLDANPALAHMFGYDSPEQALREVYDLGAQHYVNPEDRTKLVTHIRKHGSVERWVVPVYRRNREKRWISISARLGSDDDGKNLSIEGTIEDVTEQKRAEDERARLATAVEQAAEGIVITDPASVIEYVNPALEQMTGFARRDLIGRPISALGASGADRSLSASLATISREGGQWKGKVTNRRKDGTSYEAESSVSPIRGASGEISNFVVLQRDVTKETMLEQQLRHSQKMEALGTLAGGIAHDFNNILAAIVGFSEMAIQKAGDGIARKRMEQALAAGIKGKDLVKQILAFSRQADPETKPVLVRDSVEDALSLLRASLPPTLKVRFTAEKEPAFILGDPVQIQQLVLNLASNGAQAIGERRGALVLLLKKVTFSHPSEVPHQDLRPGTYVELAVKDSGVGMAPETMERMFDPFFTTKAKGEGTGLGLSIAHSIARSHGGAIAVESDPAKGSIFTVYFPAFLEDTPVSTARPEEIVGGTERILLVDDEETLVHMGRDMLEDLGYRVTAMASSKEALFLFARNPGAYDLVITDEVMPEMTGSQLARGLWAVRRDIPVMLVTGYSERVDEAKAKKLGMKAFLMKPLTKSELASTIRRVIDDPDRETQADNR